MKKINKYIIVIAVIAVVAVIVTVSLLDSGRNITAEDDSTIECYSADTGESISEALSESVDATSVFTETTFPVSTTAHVTAAVQTTQKETTTYANKPLPSDEITSFELEIVDAINEYRESIGLCSVTLNRKLSDITAIRAKEITQVWSHSRPDGSEFHSIYKEYNQFHWAYTSEILAKVGAADAQRVLTGWNNSPTHHKAIVDSRYNEIGVGVCMAGEKVYVCVHLMMQP